MALFTIPSIESVSQVNEAIIGLQEFFAKAEENSVLAGLMQASRKPRKVKDSRLSVEQDLDVSKSDIETLKAMSADEIRSDLMDEGRYSLSRLRKLASCLGIGATEKLSRDSLAHEITTKIANFRGYETLIGTDGNQ